VLVEKAIDTVKRNLLEGAVLVIGVLFLFLGNLRAALITAMVIPLSMLFTFTGMVANNVSANLLSLGALDFGIIVDGAVVIVENCVRRLAHAQQHAGRPLTREERFAEVFAAAHEARRPLLFGQLIIMIVYLPIFVLSGIEGKMFHPMAFTVVTALLGAMLLSITFVPAAVALFMNKSMREEEGRLMLAAKRRYGELLDYVMANRPVVFTAAGLVLSLSALLATRLGTEFVPNLNEGDFAVLTVRIPGTGLGQSVQMQQQIEKTLVAKFPEIANVFARTGTAEIASDPMPPSISDGYMMLKPEQEWPKPKRSREELLAAIRETLEQLPGNSYEFSQPIQLRVNELISGVRSDVAVKVFGDDLDVLNAKAAEIGAILGRIPGASGVKVEQTTGLPMLQIQVDRERAARLGLNIAEVQELIATATAGREAGAMFEGDRRFDIVVRLPEALRSDIELLKRLPVPLPKKEGARPAYVTLAEIATFDTAPGPNQLSREQGKRRVVVTVNMQDRDIGSFVEEAQQAILKGVKLPAGYWLAWGGQFENLQNAAQRRAGVHRHSVCTDRRHLRAVDARDSDVDIGSSRLHRAVRRRCAERPRDDLLHPQPARARAAAGRCRAQRCAGAFAAGADDGPGGVAWLCPHGDCDRHRRGSPAPLGHRGDWRRAVIHRADAAAVALTVPPGLPPQGIIQAIDYAGNVIIRTCLERF
jgi:cobalt-zinc-cadmium resistance protein CzcA